MCDVKRLNFSCFLMLVILITSMFYTPITKNRKFFPQKTTSFEVAKKNYCQQIGRYRLRWVGNPLTHRPQFLQIFKELVRKDNA